MNSKQKADEAIKTAEEIEIKEKMAVYEGEDRVISSDEKAKQLANLPKNEVCYQTGFPTLDRFIGRIEGGELLIVSGLTKCGKTTWCQTLTKNLYDKNIFSLWFSYEMNARQLLGKFPPKTTFLLPNQLIDKDMKWIEEKIIEAKLKYMASVVFIDHLHFIIDLMAKTPSWEVGRVIREIKKLAVKHNVIIFLICHLKKIKLGSGEVPNIDDLRDSSFIAQDSDGVFFITRNKQENEEGELEYKNQTILTIAVHRESGTMEKNIYLNYQDNQLYENLNQTKTKSSIRSKVSRGKRTYW